MPTKPSCSAQTFIAFLLILGFYGALYLFMTHPMPDKGSEAIMTMLGVLGAAMTGVVGYYFGSSIGSRNKENMIESMTKTPSAPLPPTTPQQLPPT